MPALTRQAIAENRRIEMLMDANALAREGQRHAKSLKAYVLCDRFITVKHFEVLEARQRQIADLTAAVLGEMEADLQRMTRKAA